MARGLAQSFLAGEWTRDGLLERAGLVLGRPGGRGKRAAIDSLVALVLAAFGETPPPPTLRQLTGLIESNLDFEAHLAGDETGHPRQLDLLLLPPPVMAPAPAIPAGWNIPAIVTPGELADWLNLSPRELDWLADCRGWERCRPKQALRHYRYRWIGKRAGGRRLLEMPKPRLKQLQRRILSDILDRVIPHSAAHAFRSGRSIASFVAPHVAKRIVLRIDLRDFFPSVRAARVFSLFRTIGYPEAVARLLCGLCTNSAPDDVIRGGGNEMERGRGGGGLRRYDSPHLPQGAPTSPALANLAARRLDSRLAGLAAKCGAGYTRYADDLVFSGDREWEKCLPRFRVLLLAIVLDEGFSIQHRKTQVMRSSGRQQLAGVLVNEHANIPRREYDRLRAILFNCVRFGPESQVEEIAADEAGRGRDARWLRQHLAGKIAFVRMINPRKGERLQKIFGEVEWAG